MKYYKTTTKYNCGIDLHARQMYICVMDREGNILVHKRGFFKAVGTADRAGRRAPR